ncbi:MAG: anoctamin, partial [Planctomycetota bacterium]
LRRIVERLNEGGLETKLYKSYTYDKIFCKIRCGKDRLKAQAFSIDYPLLMKEQQVIDRMNRGYKDETNVTVWRGRPITDDRHQCPSYEYYEYIYGKYDRREQERDDVKEPELKDLYEEYPSSNSIFRGVDRLKLMMSIMEAYVKDDGCSFKLRDLIAKGAVLAIFPLHDDLELHALQHQWLAYFTMPWAQPLEAIKDYYGEKVGLYFMFLGHYAGWLLAGGAFGTVVFLVNHVNHPARFWFTLLMAIFMSLWTTFFLDSWQSKQATAKMEWGMNGFEELERERPGFEGITIHSPVDGMPVKYFAPAEKSRRVCQSYVQIVLCMLYVTTINAGVFWAYAYI